MFKWAQQQLANVAGTKEPIYGPTAIKSVAEEAKETPYTELARDDMKWVVMDSTNVETKTFYLMAPTGHTAFVQVLYSNVAGIHITVQFVSKIFYPNKEREPLFCSTQLRDHEFSEDRANFYGTDCAVELSEDGKTYTIKSMTDERSIVNLTVKQEAPGFVAGKDGKTLYGTDLANPWGYMRHAFWPRCHAEGSITTPDGPIDFTGPAFLSHAMQGMKPHHAAAKWNFADFQGPTYSAIMMDFTTPPSYGSTVVNVGGIAKDGEILMAGSANKAVHLKSKTDTANDWPEPEVVQFTWNGTTKDGKTVEAVLEGEVEERADRIDVMAEVPGFVKQIVAGAVGTKPYIYQYMPSKKLSLKIKIGDEPEIVEEGRLFSEATFISE